MQNSVGYSERYNPLNHGFDRFRGFLAGNVDYVSHRSNQDEPDWLEGREQIEEEGYLTHLLTQHAAQFVRENKERPFCLYLSHGAVHTPLQAPGDPPQRGPGAQKFDKGKTEETCRRMMEELDKSVGDMVAAVDEAGIAENTLVVFFSDNGAPANFPNGSGPLRGFKGTLWEGGHRIPAIASWPGKIKAGVTTDEACISLDLMPTMLELAGVAVPQEPRLDGVSLVPLLQRGARLGERPLFWQGSGS
jgi:arylsulfatase A-like enzyme